MLIGCPDTPNHKDDFSIMLIIVKKHEIDTKFGFVAHPLHMLEEKAITSGGHIGLAAVATPKVTGAGSLAKSFKYALSYTCAKFGAFRQK